jgi:hypothetical protein
LRNDAVTLLAPETWPTGMCFFLGAVVGLAVASGAASLLSTKETIAIAVLAAGAVVGGIVGAVLRESLVELWTRW